MLDLTLYQLAIMPLLGGFFQLAGGREGAVLAHDGLFVNFLAFAIAMAFDAVVQGWFGTTLGRWLVGIRLEHVNHLKVSIYIAFYRNLDVYIKGLCLGFPVATLVAMYLSLDKLQDRRFVPWDQDFHTRVFDIAGSRERTIAVAALFLALQGVVMWSQVGAGWR